MTSCLPTSLYRAAEFHRFGVSPPEAYSLGRLFPITSGSHCLRFKKSDGRSCGCAGDTNVTWRAPAEFAFRLRALRQEIRASN